MRAIIVEDDRVISHFLARMLERIGHECVGIVDKGEDVAGAVRTLGPDVILMDIKLRGLVDGIGAAEEVRRSVPNAAIIYITGNSDLPSMERARLGGASGYLVKPIGMRELQEALDAITLQSGA